jgi:hypothetical protein
MKYMTREELEWEVADLRLENQQLKEMNTKLGDALSGQVSKRHSNTDLIMGALFSGGDVMGLAKTLAGKK